MKPRDGLDSGVNRAGSEDRALGSTHFWLIEIFAFVFAHCDLPPEMNSFIMLITINCNDSQNS